MMQFFILVKRKKKNMVIEILLFWLFFIITLLANCKRPFKYDLDTLEKTVLSAEIVKLNEAKDSPRFTIRYKVDDDKLSQLLYDLSKIEFEWTAGNPKLSKGFALKLNYADGYELICNTRIEWYDNNDVLNNRGI